MKPGQQLKIKLEGGNALHVYRFRSTPLVAVHIGNAVRGISVALTPEQVKALRKALKP